VDSPRHARVGLTLDGDRVLGTGLLTGKWFDGTSWAIPIQKHDLGATIRVVPEPSTLVLLSIGAGGLLVFAWRRRSGNVRQNVPVEASSLLHPDSRGNLTPQRMKCTIIPGRFRMGSEKATSSSIRCFGS